MAWVGAMAPWLGVWPYPGLSTTLRRLADVGRPVRKSSPKRVAILIFDGVEVLDFAGPFEVFGVTRTASGVPAFEVLVASLDGGSVLARNGLCITPQAGIDGLVADVLVVPGGYGARVLLSNPRVAAVLRDAQGFAEVTLSVCTGALLLSAAGLLRDLAATTHSDALDELRALDASVEIFPFARVVDNGRIVTSAGISAGIDASLYLIARLSGVEVAAETARYMHYDWRHRCVDGEAIVKPDRHAD